jgi:2-keto-myo-inositol isomerase
MSIDRRQVMIAALAGAALQAANKGMTPCINQRTTLAASFENACSAYASAGFKQMELWLDRLRQERISGVEALAILKKHGLRAVCACANDLKLAGEDDDFRGAVETMKSSLEYARAAECSKLVVYSTSPPKPGPEDHRRIPERLAIAAEVARTFNVTLAVEFFARSGLLGSLGTTLNMIRQSGSNDIGVCLDSFHFFAGISELLDLATVKAGEIAHVHFHDVPGSKPRERVVDADRLPPGEGVLPLQHLTDALAKAGYQGPLSVELFGPQFSDGDPREVAKRCFQAVRRYAKS